MNKASGGDGIPVELFQILKDDAVKVLHSIWQQIWKTPQWSQEWKRSVFIPIPKKVKSLSSVRLFVTPWTVAYQAPPSMEFSRQEYWNGLPFPSPESQRKAMPKNVQTTAQLYSFLTLARSCSKSSKLGFNST